MLKKLKTLYRLYKTRKLAEQCIEFISSHFKAYITNNDEPFKGKFVSLTVYKHQQKYIEYLTAFKKLVFIKSRQIGETIISNAYFLYKCLTQKNQNIFIVCTDNTVLYDLKAKIISILLTSNYKTFQIQDFGIDFSNNSQITFLLEPEFSLHIKDIQQLNNVCVHISNYSQSGISPQELIPILCKEDSQVIIVSDGVMTPNLKKIWYNEISTKVSKFTQLITTLYKVNVKKGKNE
jgi:hypothetical protein